MQKFQLIAQIRCPSCRHKKREKMTVDGCQYFYECEKCGLLLMPPQGVCCVFCAFGNIACPKEQIAKARGLPDKSTRLI